MHEPDLRTKVAFLSSPRNHAPGTDCVEVVETHRSFVFLTPSHAYKLKKAVRLDGDLTRLAEREAQCRGEVALNGRLTDGVYLGVLPLTVDLQDRLHLGGDGRVVDWLVWMRRLPAALMLDCEIAAGRVDAGRLRLCIEMLARFHASQPPRLTEPPQFRLTLARRIEENRLALARPELELAVTALEDLRTNQRSLLAALHGVIDERARAGRIVDGHGDLRPEHVCLEARPQVIDCLEFAPDLRVVDRVEEIAFLAMECARLGAPDVEALILDEYRAAAGDDAAPSLVHFYQSIHAGVRGKLAAWHVDEPGAAGIDHWVRRAREYFELAQAHVAAASCVIPA